jgi:hypothetical protein
VTTIVALFLCAGRCWPLSTRQWAVLKLREWPVFACANLVGCRRSKHEATEEVGSPGLAMTIFHVRGVNGSLGCTTLTPMAEMPMMASGPSTSTHCREIRKLY